MLRLFLYIENQNTLTFLNLNYGKNFRLTKQRFRKNNY